MKNSGIIVVNKPSGMTSFRVIDELRKKSGIKKIGHTGTLDPFATGVLPLCFSKATRLARFFSASRKGYSGEIKLGVTTDTYDLTGKILSEKKPPPIDRSALEIIFRKFTGEIELLPPMYSAKKINGTRLYEYARKGVDIERSAVRSIIYNISFDIISPENVSFSVECSSGTYIRSLAYEVGKTIGCGAHLTKLMRTMNGPFLIEQAVDLEELLNRNVYDFMISMRDIPLEMEKVTLSEAEANTVIRGNPIIMDKSFESDSVHNMVGVKNLEGDLIAIAEVTESDGNVLLQPRIVFGNDAD